MGERRNGVRDWFAADLRGSIPYESKGALMDDDRIGRVARAILFFAVVGGGIGAAITLAVAALVMLLGDSVRMGEILPALGAATALGGLAGAGFAAGVTMLGRTEDSDRLTHWKAGVAGGVAAFTVPLVAVAILAFVSGHMSVYELVESWTRDNWWLLGLGGAAGVGLNEVARRPELNPGDGDTAHLPALGSPGGSEAGPNPSE